MACLAAVGAIVFWPSPVDSGSKGTLLRVLDWLHHLGVPDAVNYGVVEFSANVVMFVPLGAFAAVALGPHRWWIALIGGPALSIGIETIQAWALPARFATLDDVVANTTGSIIGVALGCVIIALLPRTTASKLN